ncbi:MAG: hypothetical protein MUP71_09275 [Candidatus Aminicenantes bacterium]|nr:hypothetical protein [Candidatus Aminicenantes bacterium]
MKTSQPQILENHIPAPMLQIECSAASPGPHACQGSKKSSLPFNLVDIRSRPRLEDDMDLVLGWMAEENQNSIARGYGVLFKELGPDEIRLGTEQQRLIFFYLYRRLLGFVRVIELAENHWEIGSAISSPDFRRQYSGFNKLFNASSLLRISECTARENKGVARVMIVTYNEGVAHSLRNLLRSPADRFFILNNRLFDFFLIKELVTEKEVKVIEIYDLGYKLLAREMLFLFDVSACLV